MMIKNIYFKTFTNKKEYLTQQSDFLNSDSRFPFHRPLEEPIKEDFEIVNIIYNEVENEDNYEIIYFLKDYLYPQIDKMAKRYINFFKRKEEGFLDNDKSIKLAKSHIEKLFKIKGIIEKSEHLTFGTKKRVYVQLDIIQEYLSKFKILDTYTSDDKIKLAIGKHDFLTLIILLKNADVISSDLDAKLGHLIDRYFLFFKDGEFKSFNRSSKDLNDIKNGHRLVNQTIERLRIIINRPEFFEIPIPGQ